MVVHEQESRNAAQDATRRLDVAQLKCELDLCKEDLAHCRSDLEVARRLHLDLTSFKAPEATETKKDASGVRRTVSEESIIPSVSPTQSLPTVAVSESLESHLADFRTRSDAFQSELMQTMSLRASASQLPLAEHGGGGEERNGREE